MPTLSPQAEEKLIGSLKQAVALVKTDGMTPDQALTKIATEQQWGREMIKFASHAYNTGSQTAQREANDNILDKLASFPLADPDKIIAEVFPTDVKTAAEIELSGVSDEYRVGPNFLQKRDYAARQKAAAAAPWYPEVEHPELKPEPEVKMAADWNQHLKLKRAMEEARHESALAYENLLKCAGELGDYFKQSPSDRMSFAEFEKVCEVFWPGTKHIRDYVVNRNHMKEARATDATPTPSFTINRSEAPWTLIKSAVDAAKSTFEKRAAHTDAREAVEKHANDNLRPHELLPADDPGRWTLLGNVDAVKQAGLFGGALAGGLMGATGRMLSDSAKGPEMEELVSSKLQELEDPDHEAQLKQIQTQAMLADLMSNDEVIGGADPESVADAYNEISQLAPRAASQPMAMRALLRRHLQGNIEPFEIADTAKLENSLMKNESPVDPASPMIAGGPIKTSSAKPKHWLFNDNDSIL